MAINTQKVLIGGLVAGAVMNVIDFVTNTYILGARAKAESDAFKPGLADQMMSGKAVASYIVMDFILGILLVWTYAAIRPRFGPGIRTATYAAGLFWILTGIFYSGYMHMGMMSAGLWWTFAFIGLVNYLLSAWAGAKFYTEDSTV
jgi:Na+-transporting NADH:ubiquinone oxidoreductase subunit NqrB